MVDTQTITSLREKTGAGMLDCKRALDEAQGDTAKAIEILRKKGLADAAKKSSRATKEGLVASFVSADGRHAALIELNCETDFVAKNADFQALAKKIATLAAEGRTDKSKLEDMAKEAVGKIGENIVLRRFERFELHGEGLLHPYIHLGGKSGALVELSCAKHETVKNAAFQELAKELGLQIVGASPRWVSRADVPADDIAKEKEFLKAEAVKDNAPADRLEKIIEGKINKKFFAQWCLLDQPSIRDSSGKTTIQSLVSGAAAKTGDTPSVRRFARFVLGAD
jgi:elongation factor Ts